MNERDRPGLQEIVVMLSDFSFTPPQQIFEDLRKRGAMPQMAGASPRMAGMTGMAQSGASAARDLNDVKYDAFLANYRTLADPEVVKVEPGEKALLRIVNASSMTNFHVELGQLQGELIAVDGFPIGPQIGRRFPIATAQRLDIGLSLPRGLGAYPILAVVEGERKQTGIVLAAGRADIARVPEMTERPSLPLTLDFERSLRTTKPLRPRKPNRVHTINLTGEMMGYIWSLNNIVWNKAVPPLPIAAGERVELVMITAPACRIRCTCTATNSRSSRSTAHAFRAPCAMWYWCRRDAASSSCSTRTILGSGPSTATCSITWKPACSRPCVMHSRAGWGY
jgi:FtsP/CotA-like multicopper oxidase with cupredoxin domain